MNFRTPKFRVFRSIANNAKIKPRKNFPPYGTPCLSGSISDEHICVNMFQIAMDYNTQASTPCPISAYRDREANCTWSV